MHSKFSHVEQRNLFSLVITLWKIVIFHDFPLCKQFNSLINMAFCQVSLTWRMMLPSMTTAPLGTYTRHRRRGARCWWKCWGQGETWMNMLSDGFWDTRSFTLMFWWWKWVRMKDLSFEILSESIPIVSWGDELESSKIRDQPVYILTKGQGQRQNQKNRFNWVYQILNLRKCAQPCASAGIATPNAGRLQGWQRRIFSGIIAANSGQDCAHNIPSGSVPSTIIASKSFFGWLKIIFVVPSCEFCRRCQLMPCFFIANHPTVLSFPPQLPPSVEVGWTCRQLRGQAWAEGLSRGRWRWWRN